MAELGLSSVSADRIRQQLRGESVTEKATEIAKPGAGSSASFIDTLKGLLTEVNSAQVTAEKAQRDFASGKAESLHGVMIAAEKAEISLKTLVAVRNKVVEAYQDIMKMPV